MKWEHELMRDMLERAKIHLDIPSPECQKTGSMLRQAATVMSHWDRKIVDLEQALKDSEKRAEMLAFALERIAACDWPGPSPLVQSRADWMQEIAREALE